jgi:hypothetical protein
MRKFLARAIFCGIFGAVCATATNAADLSSGSNGGSSYYSAYGTRMEPIVIYDDQPGVIVRTYWSMPWGNRHYFPRTGKRPRVGRLEHISARANSRAEDFFRIWTTSSRFPVFVPPTRASQFGIAPVHPAQ